MIGIPLFQTELLIALRIKKRLPQIFSIEIVYCSQRFDELRAANS